MFTAEDTVRLKIINCVFLNIQNSAKLKTKRMPIVHPQSILDEANERYSMVNHNFFKLKIIRLIGSFCAVQLCQKKRILKLLSYLLINQISQSSSSSIFFLQM